jgi:hypothetical protein
MLRGTRIRAGLTEWQLSAAVFEGQSKVRHDVTAFETGLAIPSVRILVRLCEVLGCRMDDVAPKLDAKAEVVPAPVRPIRFSGRAAYFQKGRS